MDHVARKSDQRVCYSRSRKNYNFTCFKHIFNTLAIVSVAKQTGLSLTWSETSITVFFSGDKAHTFVG